MASTAAKAIAALSDDVDALLSSSTCCSRQLVELGARLALIQLDLAQDDDDQVVVRELQSRIDLRRQHRESLGLLSGLRALIRMVTCLTVFCVLIPFNLIASTLALANPVFRWAGLSDYQLPTELIQLYTFQWACVSLGIHVRIEGDEQVLEAVGDSPVVFMYSHASNLDPVVVGATSPRPIRFIGKRILFQIPIIGWLFALYGHISINRYHRESAIESLNEAGRQVRNCRVSIGISPEGTRSLSGHLQSFKKGSFHLASKTRLPIVPVVIDDAYDLMPVGQALPRPGIVTIRYLAPIMPPDNETEEIDREQLASNVRKAMLCCLNRSPDSEKSRSVPMTIVLYTIVPAAITSLLVFASLATRYFSQMEAV